MQTCILIADSLIAGATAIPALHGDDLIVQGAKVHSEIGPSLEMVLDGNGAADTRRVANRDVLVKGRCALNGRFVDTLVLPDGIGSSVTVYRALHGAGLVHVHLIIDDVILNQWVGGPAVHGKASKSGFDIKATCMCDWPIRMVSRSSKEIIEQCNLGKSAVLRTAGLPANTNDEVISGVPGNIELATGRGEVNSASGSVVLVVVRRRAPGHGYIATGQRQWVVRSHDEVERATLLDRCVSPLGRSSKRAGDGAERRGKTRDNNHDYDGGW